MFNFVCLSEVKKINKFYVLIFFFYGNNKNKQIVTKNFVGKPAEVSPNVKLFYIKRLPPPIDIQMRHKCVAGLKRMERERGLVVGVWATGTRTHTSFL